MKRIAMLAVITMALTALILSAAYAEEFVDPSSAFTLQLPAGWTSQETQDLFCLAGPKELSQINAAKQDSGGLTLDQFAKAFPGQMKKELKGFKLVSFGKTTVDGEPAGVWVYTAKIEKVTLKFRNYVVFPKGVQVMYNVVFATIPTRYKTDVTALDTMMKSWKWTKESEEAAE